MKRYGQIARLKSDKRDEYCRLHESVWPDVLVELKKSHIENYSIFILGDTVVSYFEYNGQDYKSDMERMDKSKAMNEWWKFSKPCFLDHESARYYEDMTDIFHMD